MATLKCKKQKKPRNRGWRSALPYLKSIGRFLAKNAPLFAKSAVWIAKCSVWLVWGLVVLLALLAPPPGFNRKDFDLLLRTVPGLAAKADSA